MMMTWSVAQRVTPDERREAVTLAARLWACAVDARRLGLDMVFVEVGTTVSSIQHSFGLTDRDMASADVTSTKVMIKLDG
jgi:hypothetical protein